MRKVFLISNQILYNLPRFSELQFNARTSSYNPYKVVFHNFDKNKGHFHNMEVISRKEKRKERGKVEIEMMSQKQSGCLLLDNGWKGTCALPPFKKKKIPSPLFHKYKTDVYILLQDQIHFKKISHTHYCIYHYNILELWTHSYLRTPDESTQSDPEGVCGT